MSETELLNHNMNLSGHFFIPTHCFLLVEFSRHFHWPTFHIYTDFGKSIEKKPLDRSLEISVRSCAQSSLQISAVDSFSRRGASFSISASILNFMNHWIARLPKISKGDQFLNIVALVALLCSFCWGFSLWGGLQPWHATLLRACN